MKKLASVLLILAVTAPQAMAVGEILSIKSRGTVYCPGRAPFNFSPAKSQPLFVEFNNNGTLFAYLGSVKNTPDFVLNIDGDQIGTRTYSYHADYLEDSYNHISAIGRIKFDKAGLIKTMTGTVIRSGLVDNCYELSKITGKRIN